MEITSINSKLLARMFLAGAKNLDSKKDWINELNVFRYRMVIPEQI